MHKPPYTAADFKASKPAVMGLVEVLFNRRLSTLLTRLLVRTPLTPNQVTVLSFLVLLPGAYLLSTGERIALIGAGLLIQLSFTLDCCDGELARLRGISSPFGAWLDGLLDRIAELALCLALGRGVGAPKRRSARLSLLLCRLRFASHDPHRHLDERCGLWQGTTS